MAKGFKIRATLFLLAFVVLSSSSFVFARGGGGGSGGGGGGGGGGGHGGGGYSGGSSHSSSPMYRHGSCTSSTPVQTEQECISENLSLLIFVVGGVLLTNGSIWYWQKKKKLDTQDPILSKKVEEVFYAFQKAWSEFDTATLEKITSPLFYQQLVLELGVLKNEHRENRMTNVKLIIAYVNRRLYGEGKTFTSFKAEVQGKAHDVLYDTELDDELYADNSPFTEYWTFLPDGSDWKLDTIEQATAEADELDEDIQKFATKNNFFYNPDFGWLMLPNKGNLFSDASFKTSDVNDHVIGIYKNKIVEFYSITFKQGGKRYFIGQAILPKSYNRIVIERKSGFSLFNGKSGLRKMSLESNAFNNEFEVYSDNADTMTTFELLHPAYMEYIMGLPYKVSIEVVGNTVYFYTTSKDIDYDKLLEILSRAFDEIKE